MLSSSELRRHNNGGSALKTVLPGIVGEEESGWTCAVVGLYARCDEACDFCSGTQVRDKFHISPEMQFTLLSAIFVFSAVTSVTALSIPDGARRELVAFDVAEKDRRDGPCMGAQCGGRRYFRRRRERSSRRPLYGGGLWWRTLGRIWDGLLCDPTRKWNIHMFGLRCNLEPRIAGMMITSTPQTLVRDPAEIRLTAPEIGGGIAKDVAVGVDPPNRAISSRANVGVAVITAATIDITASVDSPDVGD
ncbi:hypothetical protein C8J57DRAFT_1240296 [Mycena rebaudengoi]|nr:hypothetical protein C8J57DRAFT_1240296 [Mycena rebaudengoi]